MSPALPGYLRKTAGGDPGCTRRIEGRPINPSNGHGRTQQDCVGSTYFWASAGDGPPSKNRWMWYVGGGVAAVAVGTLTYFLVTRSGTSTNHQTQLCFDGDCP